MSELQRDRATTAAETGVNLHFFLEMTGKIEV